MFTIHPIGYVSTSLQDVSLAPKQGDEGASPARLDFLPDMAPGLQHLRVGDSMLLLTWLHMANRALLEVHPRDDPSAARRGVFSTRSADRPNPIGIHRVTIVDIAGPTSFAVDALEAIDQTPIIDIKPVLPNRSER
jgi:tRNA-Thr(GGU) m(6)t(6)A37 methyltransferase TsaA